jgi:hypothetical protein
MGMRLRGGVLRGLLDRAVADIVFADDVQGAAGAVTTANRSTK